MGKEKEYNFQILLSHRITLHFSGKDINQMIMK